MENVKKKNVKRVSLMIGLLLIAAALFIGGSNIYEERKANQNVQTALARVISEMETSSERTDDIEDQLPAASQSKSKNMSEDDSTSDSKDSNVDSEANDDEMATIQVDNSAYIGILSIPALGLEVPIISASSDAALSIAPCRYSGSVYSNDLILAGHNYSSHFGSLGNLYPGASVNFTTADGEQVSYVVQSLEIIDGNGGVQMASGQWDLTLFTCTASGTARVTVRCQRVG